MASFLKQLTDLWTRMKFGQRVTILIAVAGTLALMTALIIYGTQPEFGVLFSDLKPADAQTIVEKLKTQNVQYKLTNNGTVVSVPSDHVAELRLLMASSGALAGGHVGFDIFDRASFGATEFTQQVNYQRAIEGELAKTLEGLDEVESARVHVTQPHESIYADKAERAKASVMVRMRQGRVLTRERTEAVVSLLASAVEGLDPADVAVMDTQGRLLASSARGASGGGGDAGTFSSKLEASRKFEAETAARIVSLIEPISGVGHVRADVAANLDFSQIEQTKEEYDPKSQVIRSQQNSQESRNSNANGGAAHVVGVRANDPALKPAPVAGALPATSGDQRVAGTTNYEMNKTVTRTVGGGGRVSRLSVSVVVDYKNVAGVSTTRTPEELKKIQDLVGAAVGIDDKRGDQIVVQTIPFDQPTVEIHTATWLEKNGELVRAVTKYGLLALATLLLLIFVVRPAKRALRLAANSPRLLGTGDRPALLALGPGSPDHSNNGSSSFDSPRTVAEIEADMEAQVAREMASFTPDLVRSSALRKQLVERSKKQPESVAMTVRGWLQEGAK
jgi:flagellar M-ring protein FliF